FVDSLDSFRAAALERRCAALACRRDAILLDPIARGWGLEHAHLSEAYIEKGRFVYRAVGWHIGARTNGLIPQSGAITQRYAAARASPVVSPESASPGFERGTSTAAPMPTSRNAVASVND